MAQTEAVRLYVGGLPADITAEAIAQRFAPFGKVISSELVPAKCSGIGIASQPGTCRGFAYVSLQPKDATSVSRCLSLVRDALPHLHLSELTAVLQVTHRL